MYLRFIIITNKFSTMKNLIFGLITLLVIASGCQKSALVENSGTPTTSENLLKSLITTYPASLISTPIITSGIPDAIAESQTPIDIITGKTVKFVSSMPVVHYNMIKLKSILNNLAENLKVNVDPSDTASNYVIFNGKKYDLAQFHFHYHSEHTINGQYSTMEVHFVNISADKSYAVLGVLFNLGGKNEALGQLFHASPTVSNGVNSLNKNLNVTKLFPENIKNYYTYTGSLTTPNYGLDSDINNGGPVTWVLYKDKQHVSSGDYNYYKGIYLEPNFRTIRPLNGRKVYENVRN